MRTTVGSRGGRRAGVLACGALLSALAAGCAQSVPGTAHPEGEGPTTSSGSSVEAAPPTDFQEPSGRPTVTVQPDATAPLIPGPLSTAPPTPPPSTPAPVPPRSTSAPDRSAAPPAGRGSPPLAAAPGTPARSAAAPGTPGRSAAPRAGRGSPPQAAPDRSHRTGQSTGAHARPRPGGPPPPAVRSAPSGPSGPSGPAAPALLTADVVRNECLLDGKGFATLLGGAVGKPAQTAVVRPDGSSTRSCYAMSRSGDPAPTAAVNVYRVNRGTPAGFVRATSGGRPIPRVGEAAVLLDTVGGTTLQVATPRYLVTVNVVDATPSVHRWAAAGRAVVAAAGRP